MDLFMVNPLRIEMFVKKLLFVLKVIDRVIRNMNDLTNIMKTLNGKGAALEILDQKKEIRTKNKAGMNPTTLSKEYGVSRSTIYNVLKETA